MRVPNFLLAAAALLTAIAGPPSVQAQAQPIELEWLDAETVRFAGPIQGEAKVALLRVLDDGAKTLIVTSPGGRGEDTAEVARRLRGSFARLVVRDYCLDACALHLFAAARFREMEAGALVAFPTLTVSAAAELLNHHIRTYADLTLAGMVRHVAPWAATEQALFAHSGAPRGLLYAPLLETSPTCFVIQLRHGRPYLEVDRRYDYWVPKSKESLRRLGMTVQGPWIEEEAEFQRAIEKVSNLMRGRIGVFDIPENGIPALSRLGTVAACTDGQMAKLSRGEPPGLPEASYRRPLRLKGRAPGARIANGTTLEVTGHLDWGVVNQIGLLNLAKVDKVSVRLQSADHESALYLGRLIRRRGWPVVVDGYCLGACLASVLLASPSPAVMEDSIVGLMTGAGTLEILMRNGQDKLALLAISKIAEEERRFHAALKLPENLSSGALAALKPLCATRIVTGDGDFELTAPLTEFQILVPSAQELEKHGVRISGYPRSGMDLRRAVSRAMADIKGAAITWGQPLASLKDVERVARALPACNLVPQGGAGAGRPPFADRPDAPPPPA